MIRPISRDSENTQKHKLQENFTVTSVNKNNKVNNNKKKTELTEEKKKETLIIEKDPIIVPIESWAQNNTQVDFNELELNDNFFVISRQRRITSIRRFIQRVAGKPLMRQCPVQ